MYVQSSRGDRRRRWWLRAQAALARQQGPSDSLAVVGEQDDADRTTSPDVSDAAPDRDQLWDRFRADAGVPGDVQLRLEDQQSGTRLTLPLNEPFLLIGKDAACQLQLQGGGLLDRHAALIWASGRLYVVDLSRSNRTPMLPVRPWTPGTMAQWGSWQAQIDGLPAPGEPTDEASWRLELLWGRNGPAAPTPLLNPITLIGASPACDVGLPQAGLSAVHAAVLRMRHSVWVVALEDASATRVNGRVVEFSPLDPGDSLGVGERTAWLTARWAESSPVSSTSGQDREQLEQYLIGQTARLTQMQQSLSELLQQEPNEKRVRLSLEHFRQLAAECENHAARLIGANYAGTASQT